jgi:hypothetical protein
MGPAMTAAGLTLFFGYLFVRAFHPIYAWYEPYISPTVGPPAFAPLHAYPGSVPLEHAWFGAFPSWWPAFLPESPAFFFPSFAIAFRFTCYYYRKSYYRAIALTPPACAVSNPHLNYKGETALLIFQNLHRYTLYGGLFLLPCLWWEGFAAFFRNGQLGIGLGMAIPLTRTS